MGRPRKYANDAEKAAAARARTAGAVAEIRLTPELMARLTRIAEKLDVSRTELINSMIKLALTNRNWERDGLTGAPLPKPAALTRKGPAEHDPQSWGMLKGER